MRCAHCEGDNPPSAKFCSHCGSGLSGSLYRMRPFERTRHPFLQTNVAGLLDGATAPAPVAGFGSPAGPIQNPKHLAEKILTSKSALEGERSRSRCFFLRHRGVDGVAEQLDPRARMKCWIEYCGLWAEIFTVRGTVNSPRRRSDGPFRGPLALEDHAVRAIEAALSIQETINGSQRATQAGTGARLEVAPGTHSGLVVVAGLGMTCDGLHRRRRTTNVAARIQR